jgi:hypothetical protein
MFDKTFFRFALGFMAIILLSLGALYVADHFGARANSPILQTAAAR